MIPKIFQNVKKPQNNLGGRLMLAGMNQGHERLAAWARPLLDLQPHMELLDIGCGGGRNLKIFSRFVKKAYGVDYSEESVRYSLAYNKREAEEGRVAVVEADAISLPFPDHTFHIVTAFETVYFWEPIEKGLQEAHRVLKKKGQMLIVCETDSPQKAGIWSKEIGFKVHTGEELVSLLSSLDMKCTLFTNSKKHWIAILAIKN